MGLLQDPAVADQPGEAARRVRPAAESEQEELVARLVLLSQESVAAAHVAGQPVAEGAAEDALIRGGSDPGLVEELLPAVAARGEAQRDLRDVRRRGHAVTDPVREVPRPVTAHGKPFRHRRADDTQRRQTRQRGAMGYARRPKPSNA
jgi:hypothetical protein